MKLVLIRHGKTAGNEEGRYVGRTDEMLSENGAAEIVKKARDGVYPAAQIVLSSPMKRCVQTAGLIYPKSEVYIEADFRETDFGEFEYKNYIEMREWPVYQKWINSGGVLSFPGGEDPDVFRRRCRDAFLKIARRLVRETGTKADTLSSNTEVTAAFVVHGGTIMSVLSGFEEPKAGYFDRRVENGGGYICEFDGENEKLTVLYEI